MAHAGQAAHQGSSSTIERGRREKKITETILKLPLLYNSMALFQHNKHYVKNARLSVYKLTMRVLVF